MSRSPIENWFRLLSACTIVVLVAVLVAATAVSTIKPVLDRDFADPMVLTVGSTRRRSDRRLDRAR